MDTQNNDEIKDKAKEAEENAATDTANTESEPRFEAEPADSEPSADKAAGTDADEATDSAEDEVMPLDEALAKAGAGDVMADEKDEATPKKRGFHWFFWLIVVVLVFGIVVGFYYPSFYGSANEYVRYMADKVMGKEPVPLRMAGQQDRPREGQLEFMKIGETSDADEPAPAFIGDETSEETEPAGTSAEEPALEKEAAPQVTQPEAAEAKEPLTAETAATAASVMPNETQKAVETVTPEAQNAQPLPEAKASVKEPGEALAQIQKLEAEVQYKNDLAMLAKSAIDLRKAAMSGHNFAGEIAAFAKVKNTNEAIEKDLAALAIFKKGIKKEAVLRAEFDILFKKAIAVPYTHNKADFWDKTLGAVKSVVIIRKTDGSDGGLNAALTSAEKAVLAGDMPKAAKKVSALPAAQRAIFARWARDVMAWHRVNKASANIVDETISLMAATSAGENTAKAAAAEPSAPAPKNNDDKEGK